MLTHHFPEGTLPQHLLVELSSSFLFQGPGRHPHTLPCFVTGTEEISVESIMTLYSESSARWRCILICLVWAGTWPPWIQGSLCWCICLEMLHQQLQSQGQHMNPTRGQWCFGPGISAGCRPQVEPTEGSKTQAVVHTCCHQGPFWGLGGFFGLWVTVQLRTLSLARAPVLEHAVSPCRI